MWARVRARVWARTGAGAEARARARARTRDAISLQRGCGKVEQARREVRVGRRGGGVRLPPRRYHEGPMLARVATQELGDLVRLGLGLAFGLGLGFGLKFRLRIKARARVVVRVSTPTLSPTELGATSSAVRGGNAARRRERSGSGGAAAHGAKAPVHGCTHAVGA